MAHDKKLHNDGAHNCAQCDRLSSERAPFAANDRMRNAIHQVPELLMVLRRFGITLGFGNATIADVCRHNGIDCPTFLAVANFSAGRPWSEQSIDVATLLRYLQNAHKYFLNFALPTIRRKLIEALPIGEAGSVNMLILRYFDDYAEEVRRHMAFEDEHVFPYVARVLEGVDCDSFDIAEFEAGHLPLAPKLHELKEIFISHYKSSGNEDLLNSALFDIIILEADLTKHCGVEDTLLVPSVQSIQERLRACRTSEQDNDNNDTDAEADDTPELSQREREIVQGIAKGLSAKEIADRLCLSVHTVNTHRRNICSKLDIHSTAGLAIYAILHHLVDITDLSASDLR